jgi:hypothetical protein
VAVFTQAHTFNKETAHTSHEITQHCTNSTMDINKYKNRQYKYNEHKQYTEHFKTQEKRKKQTVTPESANAGN